MRSLDDPPEPLTDGEKMVAFVSVWLLVLLGAVVFQIVWWLAVG